MSIRNFSDREIPVSQSAPFSFAEASGATGVAVDLLPTRRCRVPADWPSPILRFLDSSNPRPRSTRRSAVAHHPVGRPPLSAA